jgi:hypothetical protein
MADTDKQPTVKQGAVTPRTLKVHNFRGAYRDAVFNDDCVSVAPVSPETEEALRKHFPKAKVTAVTQQAAGADETTK